MVHDSSNIARLFTPKNNKILLCGMFICLNLCACRSVAITHKVKNRYIIVIRFIRIYVMFTDAA